MGVPGTAAENSFDFGTVERRIPSGGIVPIPVGGPLPGVPRHVIQTESIRFERCHRRGQHPAIDAADLTRATAILAIVRVTMRERVSCCVFPSVLAGARRKLPFCFCG